MKKYSLALITLSLIFSTNMTQAQDPPYWWNNTIFYEIFVRSFYDSDDDGTGDIGGLIEKLDYLNDGDPATTTDLGITGIWLMPISPSPSSHGYDVTDYRGINPDYGNLELFSAFIDSAHARGIKVIIDYVMNHSSDQHPNFISSEQVNNSPYRDWYIWEEENPGFQGPWGQYVWHYSFGDYYYGLFWGGMPDNNYTNPDVKDEMFDVARFWLDSLNVDGFRLDAIKYLVEDGQQLENTPETFQVLNEFRNFYKDVNPLALTVGEVWDNTGIVSQYSDGNGMDMCFEFDLASSIINGIRDNQPSYIRNQMELVIDSYPALQYAPFLSNHDQERVYGDLFTYDLKMKMAVSILMTLPGVPFLYYGEEVGMTGSNDDGTNRTPMQWSPGPNAGFSSVNPWFPINDGYVDFNVATLQDDPESIWNHYRNMIHFRNENLTLQIGEYDDLSTDNLHLLAYARSSNEGMIMSFHNFFLHVINDPAVSLSSSIFSAGDYVVVDPLSGEELGSITLDENGGFSDWNAPVSLSSFSSAFLKIEPDLSIDDDSSIPLEFELYQNYPNPFNPETIINYKIPYQEHIIISIFNVNGQQIEVILDENKLPGRHSVRWDASDQPAGFYFARLQFDDEVLSSKMISIK